MILMMIRAYSLFLAGWLLLPQTAYAEPVQPEKSTYSKLFNFNILKSLFDSMKRKQAYAYARHHLPEMEGDPFFDYLYGVSAIDSGDANEGVFALERVLVSYPGDLVARLELARGYFVLQEYAQSKDAFEIVLKTNPPKHVRDTAESYLDQIRVSESRYRPTHSGFLEFTMGSDDNVNAGIDESTNFFGFRFTPDSLSQDDNFTALTGAWNYAHPISPGNIFESSVTANVRKNLDLSQFDTNTLGASAGFTQIRASSKYKTSLVAQQFMLDGESYRTLAGINFDWQYTLSQQSSLTSTIQYTQLDYTDQPGQPSKDSSLSTLGVSFLQSFSAYLQPVFFATVSLSAEAADESNSPSALANTERDITNIRTGVMLNFTNTLALEAGIGLQSSQYGGKSIIRPTITREDDYSSANLGLIWAFARKWRFDSRFNYTKNDSTLDLYDYERNVFEMTLNYTF